MDRRWLLLTWMLLTACGGTPSEPVYPLQVAGGFKLQSRQVLTGDQIPNYVPASGRIRVIQLIYAASNTVQVVVFETTGSSVAFEALQKWRARQGKTAIHAGTYFVVAQVDKLDPVTLNMFLDDFEKQLK